MLRREGYVRLVVVALAALVPLTIAGCGASESDKTPKQILQDASAATKAVSGYHVSGAGQSGGSTAKFDLRISGPGALDGSLTSSGVPFELIVINEAAYIKGHEFLQQIAGAQAAQVFDDNWVKVPQAGTGDLTQGVSALTDTKKFGGCLVSGLSGLNFAKSTATVNGQSVVVLRAPAITLDFAVGGPTYIVQATASGATSAFNSCMNGALGGSSGSGGTLNFDSWGSVAAVSPPPHPIDASGLTAG